MISYLNEGIKCPKLPKRQLSAWIKQVAAMNLYSVGNITYIFCTDEKILEVNKQYLQHNYYTDIISFDYTEKKTIHGDIFISLETVASNAKKFKVSFDQELYRVVIHGVLHLCGQKDTKAQDKIEMTRKENEALALVSF